MKKFFTLLLLLCAFVTSFAQWTPTSMQGEKIRNNTNATDYFKLDLSELRAKLADAEETGRSASPVEISLPTIGGKIEQFAVYSQPVVAKELAAQYQLGSYVGVGISDPSKYIRFSVAPNDFQAMILHEGAYQFIEPANKTKTVYQVFQKSVSTGGKAFICSTNENPLAQEQIDQLYTGGQSFAHNPTNFAKNSDKKYRTMRLALSVTAEYTTFFGGVPGAMAAINATLTRVNGVFEKDFALRLIMQNYPALIYTNAATDPYDAATLPAPNGMDAWNNQLQQTLTAVVGNANYDIGHLFGGSGGGGNAGCIGCVCVNPTGPTSNQKGSGYTSPSNGVPAGDTFDIDYVAHEMGHQLGATHTFSHQLEGAGTNVEPGSGSTIMGYAGITGPNTDVQSNSDDYFHAASIGQVQTNLVNKTCDIEVAVANNPPVITPLPTYNIPKGTAFVLTGTATDPNPMTYTWEQMNNATGAINSTNLGNTASGASFRSVEPTSTGATRYFPRLQSVLAGVLNNSTNTWEAVSTVARTTQFAFTVRDNNPIPTEQQTQTANQTIIVGNDGPFIITSTTGSINAALPLTWNAVNTAAAPYNVANVKIDYTLDNGLTWVTLLASTPNDGSENVTFTGVPNNATVKVRVSAINNVFYAIKSMVVTATATCLPVSTTTVAAITVNSATLGWSATAPVPANGYAYYISTTNTPPTAATIPTGTSATVTANATGLVANTTYYWWVKAVCSGTDSSIWIQGVTFSTPATLPYVQPFTTGNDFTFVNGTQTNKWVYGSAVGNPANSIYISNDNGVTNSYANTLSVVQAYREFVIPAGSTNATLFFDWKAVGESSFDYFRVWLVPATFTPTAGTQITAGAGRIQLGANYNQQAGWQTYFNPNVNISSFQGSNMRLVFEWRNDGSVNNPPPVSIDNINFSVPTCQVPTNPNFSLVTQSTATLTWTAANPVPANGYHYYLSTNNTAPTTATVPTGSSTTTSAPLTGLLPNTVYYYWVRSNCGPGNTSFWMAGPSFTTGQIPATMPYVQPFTTGPVDFTFVNGTHVNKWVYGSAAGNPANSIYISNDNGVTNTYDIAPLTTVQAYRDITVPAGTTNVTLSFDWRAVGQTTLDYFRVWVVPVTFNPIAGTQITAGAGRIQVGGTFNLQPTWQNYFNHTLNLSSFAGNTVRLVFEWRNNAGTGDNPPAAIDNINLSIPTCQVPTNLNFNTVTTTTANITWAAAVPVPANGYQYYVSASSTPPVATTIPTGSATTLTAALAGLQANTTYYFWVRSVCGPGNNSFWMAGPSFITRQIAATMPYQQPFTTGPVDFTFVNGNQANKWHYGAAAGNPPNAIYISNDNGVTNTYSNTLSVTQAYRDITIPAGATTAIFAFDWKAAGESSFDYLRVWLVRDTYTPTAGTQITALAGQRIQVGTNLNLQPTWQNYLNNNLDISAFENQTMRLVFEWRNDGSVANQTPVAIDNVRLVRCSNAAPAVTVTAITHNSATVSWTQDPGGASYIIRYREIGSSTWITANIAALPFPATAQSYDLTTLSPVTQYEVEVAAVCQTSQGMFSHNEFETKCDPTPPSSFVVNNITTNSAVVSWAPVLSATYILQYREVGSATWIPVNLTGTTYNLTGLTPYTTYEVQVASICSGATNPFTTPIVFTTLPTCEMAPIGLTVTNLTMTSAEVNWNAFAGATYVLKWRKVGHPTFTTVNLNVNTYLLTGLLEATQYEVQVANVCGGTLQAFTSPYIFTTPSVDYCPMIAGSSAEEHISNVKVNPAGGLPEMSNNSGATTYSSYIDNNLKTIRLIQGSTNNQISVSKTWAGTQYNEAVTVWIDFNRNSTFEVGERILTSPPNKTNPVTGTFTVPSNAFVSLTNDKYVVMRVVMQRDGSPISCVNFPNGEVEDYKVMISKSGTINALDPNTIFIYPNPVDDILNISKVSDGALYTIYNAAGQLISKGKIYGRKINVSNLERGVYVIDVDNNGETAQKKFIKN